MGINFYKVIARWAYFNPIFKNARDFQFFKFWKSAGIRGLKGVGASTRFYKNAKNLKPIRQKTMDTTLGTAFRPIVILSSQEEEEERPALNLFDGEPYQPPMPTSAQTTGSQIEEEEEKESGLSEPQIRELKADIRHVLEQHMENRGRNHGEETLADFSRAAYAIAAWVIQGKWGQEEEVHGYFNVVFDRWAQEKRLPSVESDFTEVEPEEEKKPEEKKAKKPLSLIGFKPNRIY